MLLRTCEGERGSKVGRAFPKPPAKAVLASSEPATYQQTKPRTPSPRVREVAACVDAYRLDTWVWQRTHCSACKHLKQNCICAIFGPSFQQRVGAHLLRDGRTLRSQLFGISLCIVVYLLQLTALRFLQRMKSNSLDGMMSIISARK